MKKMVSPGQQFGMWTVIKEVSKRDKQRYIKCKCRCGHTTETVLYLLTSGKNTQCNICSGTATYLERYNHVTDKRTYTSWLGMNRRCYDKGGDHYHRYGGRGITVCDEWRKSKDNPRAYINFAENMGKRPENTTLDREDNDGNYEPGNCRWATPEEQSSNLSTNNSHMGVKINICKIARDSEVDSITLWRKIKNNPNLELEKCIELAKESKRRCSGIVFMDLWTGKIIRFVSKAEATRFLHASSAYMWNAKRDNYSVVANRYAFKGVSSGDLFTVESMAEYYNSKSDKAVMTIDIFTEEKTLYSNIQSVSEDINISIDKIYISMGCPVSPIEDTKLLVLPICYRTHLPSVEFLYTLR